VESIEDIKYRMRSIREMRQITKAMHLISVAKVKGAMDRYEANASYFKDVRKTLKDILAHTHDIHHPFLEHRAGERAAYIVIAGDKGLAGGYNHNVLRTALDHMKNKEEKYIFTVGQIGREFSQEEDLWWM
jgi:F-type H+-transporting ATPase subunit gamma